MILGTPPNARRFGLGVELAAEAGSWAMDKQRVAPGPACRVAGEEFTAARAVS
jgi:hypothetical protein